MVARILASCASRKSCSFLRSSGRLLARIATANNAALTRIAFGSCARESDPQPIWDAIVAGRPELFIFTGDNIYGDTADMTVMRPGVAPLHVEANFRVEGGEIVSLFLQPT